MQIELKRHRNLKKPNICQDRLGTSIGKAENDIPFLQGIPREGLVKSAVYGIREYYRCERKTPLLSNLCIKTIILPRQARDRHRESGEKEMRFWQGGGAEAPRGPRAVPCPLGKKEHNKREPFCPLVSQHYKRLFYQDRLGASMP
jgi:hypothetical protein